MNWRSESFAVSTIDISDFDTGRNYRDSIKSQHYFAITADTCWKESRDLREKTQTNVSLQSCFKEIKLEMYTIAQVSAIYLGRKYLKVSILF
jgi:hypothetical protein